MLPKISLFLLFCFCTAAYAGAQCLSTVSSYPYLEDFEQDNGGWLPGGTASEWSWGTPLKPVINGAASGSKCWITGTLTQSVYSNNQNSSLTSPCFDFSGLANPYISFSLFWETERKYDGASIQYSVNGGTSWQTLGSYSDYTACPSSNWFNTSGITTLGSDGWSGNIQPSAPCAGGAGNGSGQWVKARKSVAFLGGMSNVKFRFRFAAGSVCNNYDGFAIDDFFVGEAPAGDADFNFTCGQSNQVSFSIQSMLCNASYSWNFGDPDSGPLNTSTQVNPTHFFANPGNYTVSLVVSSPLTSPVTVTRNIRIIELSATQLNHVLCNGDKTAAIQVAVSPAGNYNYSWNTSPVQESATAGNLGAGTYNVTVTGDQTCPSTETITIEEPAKFLADYSVEDPVCGRSNGRISLNISGGTPAYQYNWTPLVSTASTAEALGPGNYSVAVNDGNGCQQQLNFTLVNQEPLAPHLGNDTVVCDNGTVVLSPGNFDSYTWQNGSALSTFQVHETGVYHVTVTGADGCEASDSIFINYDCRDLYFPNAFTPGNNGINDDFGPLGDLSAIQEFSIRIYNRWGQLVFQSADPKRKWDGKFSAGERSTGTYVWMAAYRLNGRPGRIHRKGVVTIIR